MPLSELAKKGIKSAYDIVSPKAFRDWKNSDKDLVKLFDDYVFGEIFWRKSIGRPKTKYLADAFTIVSSRASKLPVIENHQEMLVDITLPNLPSWRDGKSDDQYWRVSYMIPHIPDGHHKDLLFGLWDEFTFITPELVKGVSWSAPPGGRFGIGGFGLRVIEPDSVVFVKEEGVKYISFEVVTRLPLVFAKSGVAKP